MRELHMHCDLKVNKQVHTVLISNAIGLILHSRTNSNIILPLLPLPTAKHELFVTTYQCCILCCFNQSKTLSYSDLVNRTKIPEDEFRRHLQSLYVHPKCKILVKTTSGNPNESSSGSSAPAFSEPEKTAKKEPQEGETIEKENVTKLRRTLIDSRERDVV
jgi:hypothetical protein